jgi:hypothetical protein
VKMLKARYTVEPTGEGNAYRLTLPRKKVQVTMAFNDWLNFLRKLLVQTDDFDLSRLFKGLNGLLYPCQVGFMVETFKPHMLLLYIPVDETILIHHIDKYRPQYGRKTEMPLSHIH